MRRRPTSNSLRSQRWLPCSRQLVADAVEALILPCYTASLVTPRLIVFALLLLASSLSSQTFWDQPATAEGVDALLSQMSDEERVAQVFLLGWASAEPSAEIREWITRRNVGGVKIFGWNANDLPTLARAIGTMQSDAAETAHAIPLFTATDQEGGWVRHVKGTGSMATTLTPGNMAIGASGLPLDAYHTARFIGQELRTLGINMNFAPTVDVFVNPEAHVIGPRAFSADAELTGLLGLAYYEGMEQTRVIATAKHFPGHGNATGDSHGVLPVIEDDLQTLWERELLPYRYLIPEGLPAVLSGHLSFPAAAGDEVPASISEFFTHEMLRERLGFEGLVITDDLYMAGVWIYGNRFDWGIAEIVVAALEAGNDMVMLSRTPAVDGHLWNTVLGKYRSDEGFRDKIDAAVRRILTIKYRYLRADDRVPLYPQVDDIAASMQTPEGDAFFRDQAARSVTLVRGELPYQPAAGERVLIAGKYGYFIQEARRFFPQAQVYRFQDQLYEWSSERDIEAIQALAGEFDTIVFCLSDPSSLGILQSIAPGELDARARVIVVSALSPVFLRDVEWVDTAIAIYGWGVESYRAGFSALVGTIEPRGSMPIDLSPSKAAAGDER